MVSGCTGLAYVVCGGAFVQGNIGKIGYTYKIVRVPHCHIQDDRQTKNEPRLHHTYCCGASFVQYDLLYLAEYRSHQSISHTNFKI